MKIQGDIRAATSPYKVNSAQSTPAPEAVAAASVAGADQVTVSERARRVSSLRRQIRTAPQTRGELVNRLKAQIEEGTYNVEAEKVAAKLLRAKVLDP